MTKEEAIEVVKSNWPPAHYTMLAEALTVLISHDDAIRRECADRAHEQCSAFMTNAELYMLRSAILGTEPAQDRDIAGEVWDMLSDKLPARGRTELYDEMRKRFPAISGSFSEPAREESEESRDERLATKQLLGAGCHDEYGELSAQDAGEAETDDIVAYIYDKRSDGVPLEILQYFPGADEIYKGRHCIKIIVIMRAAELKRRIEAAHG